MCGLLGALAALISAPTLAQDTPPGGGQAVPVAASAPQANLEELAQLRRDVAQERAALAEQIEALRAQQQRLAALERRLSLALGEPVDAPAMRRAEVEPAQQSAPQTPQPSVAQRQAANTNEKPDGAVGVAPEEERRQPEIAALGREGSAITQQGRLSGEVEWSYARADRNRALFRGVEVVESVLVGVFDINENRQDVFTNKIGLQYGLMHDLEVGIDVPFVARWNTSVLTPVAGPGENGQTREIDNSANGYGIGDIELSVRKQLHAPTGFGAYVIGDLQATIPTGTGPFEVNRNEFGEASEAATGSGFWSLSPGITAILPSDPGVVFGSVSYTKNFAGDVNADIPPVLVTRADPGDSLSVSGGIGLALNPRLSLNFGYAHTWGFGTETTTVDPGDPTVTDTRTSRDLQIGRFLFGSTYKVDNRTSVNFALEAGLTDDATDMRAMIRIPFVF